MPLYRTTFPIDASAAQTWAALTDFATYGEWNPSLPRIAGDLSPGSTVELTLGMPGRPKLNVQATLQDVETDRKLTWRGSVGGPRVFAGYREFSIEPTSDSSVAVTHIEDITGALAPVFAALNGRAAQRSHDDFNEALKRRAESGAV